MIWLCKHKWQIIAVLLVAAVSALWVWTANKYKAEISTLNNELIRNERELRQAERRSEELYAQLGRKQEELKQLQQNNDQRMKEVGANAYKKARSISDDDLLAAYNRLISGARRRNTDRERTYTSTEE